MGNASGAAFLANGTDPSTGGFDATSGEVVNLQLKASPALDITECVYSVVSSDTGAPAPTFSNGGVASPPTAIVTVTMPVGGTAHTYQIQCQTNDGAAVRGPTGKLDDFSVNTQTRVVAIRNSAGLRKMFVGEGVEYSPAGWVDIVNALVDNTAPSGAQPSVQTTDSSTVNLLATAVPIPAGKGVRIRATLSGNIVTQTLFYRTALTIVADYVRPTSGSASLAYSNPIDLFQPAYPWCARGAGPIAITGAASDGGTQVEVEVTSSNDLAAGNTVTVAGAVTSGGLVLDGQWVIDSVPDGTHLVLRGSVWTGAWVSGGTVTPNGAVGLSLVSSAVQVIATGITAAPWMASEDVHGRDLRANVNGLYVYTDPGTTSASGPGPSGTSGTDGTAPYVRIGSGPGVSIVWSARLDTFPS